MKKINEGIMGIIIVWIGVITSSAIILSGTKYFANMLPILGG